jgi:hypothetical protein
MFGFEDLTVKSQSCMFVHLEPIKPSAEHMTIDIMDKKAKRCSLDDIFTLHYNYA